MRQDIQVSRLGRTFRCGAPHLALAITMVAASLASAPADAQRAQSRSGGAESRASSASPSGQSSGRHAVPRSSSGGSSGSSYGGSSSGSHRRTGTEGTRRAGRGRGYYPSYGYGYGSYYYGRYGYYGYPLYWSGAYSHYPYHYYPYYGGYVVSGSGSAATRVPLGAIDVNVKPKRAQVFVDGRYVGLVKNFDGFPNYLWLEEGEYELTFYLPGYANLSRHIQVIPGEVIDFQDRLSQGVGEVPEPPAEAPVDAPWENRPARVISAGEDDENDLREDPARLYVDVSPPGASVYLDGRFLGSARELTNLRAPLIIDHGDHVLQVVHPDYPTEKVEFDADSGEELRVEVDLSTG